MTTLRATYTTPSELQRVDDASLDKVSLLLENVNKTKEEGSWMTNRVLKRNRLNPVNLQYYSKTLGQTGGLHISVKRQSSSPEAFNYKLTLVFNEMDTKGRPVKTSYIESVSITFPENGKPRKIMLSERHYYTGTHQIPGELKIDGCDAWYYIPLDGVRTIDNSMNLREIAETCTKQIMEYHGGSLPKPNMQDIVLIYVIRCILKQLSPPKDLIIQPSEKRKLQAGYVKDEGRGKLWELTGEGIWKQILYPELST